jgi:hypothetical protein
MQYFKGGPPDQPPKDPGMVLFLFFSSDSTHAFMVPSWSMAVLANSLKVRLGDRFRQSCSCMVSPLWKSLAFFMSMSMWCAPYYARLLNSWQYSEMEWFCRCLVPQVLWVAGYDPKFWI